MDSLAQTIRELRTALEDSQKDFAQRLGTSQATVARWETGQITPAPETIRALAAIAVAKGLIQADELEAAARGETTFDRRRIRPSIQFRDDDEKIKTVALLRVLRNPEHYAAELKLIEKALKKPLEDTRTILAELQMGRVDVPAAMLRLYQDGRSLDEIASLFNMDPADISGILLSVQLAAAQK
jgi:transcriptional regulator with XRE-family HTH domain